MFRVPSFIPNREMQNIKLLQIAFRHITLCSVNFAGATCLRFVKPTSTHNPKSVHWTRFGEHPSGLFRKQLLRKPVEAHTLQVPSNNTSDTRTLHAFGFMSCVVVLRNQNPCLSPSSNSATNRASTQTVHWTVCLKRLSPFAVIRLKSIHWMRFQANTNKVATKWLHSQS